MKKKPLKKFWQIFIQDGVKCKMPYCEESKKAIDKYKVNQIVHGTIVGESDPRSPEQLRTYWQACTLYSHNSDNPHFATKEMVDFQMKHELNFYDYNVYVIERGVPIYAVLSISIENMEHIDACDYFNKAFDVMASDWGMTREEFVETVKNSCKGGR